MKKRFSPCIYLYRGHAVRDLQDLTVIDADPVRLAGYYCENNADELFVFDMSGRDAQDVSTADALHEEALGIIKAICQNVQVDVIGAGNIKRMEDVKKLLYCGCRKAMLNWDKPSNVALAREVSLKFGADKLLACGTEPALLTGEAGEILEYVSGLLLLDSRRTKELLGFSKLPLYVQVQDIALNKLLGLFSEELLQGVTGNTINDNVKEILSIKELCRENNIPVESLMPQFSWADFHKNSDGLVPVIVQDEKTAQVLMMAYMNEDAYNMTFRTGKMTYFSRSRQSLWVKGETSGHYQYVKALWGDCDMDTILAKVSQVGVACHTGAKSCFFQEIVNRQEQESENPLTVFQDVYDVILDRKIHPKEGSYTNYLFDKGLDKILKKLGEEATEIVIAAKNPNANEVKYEISDFLYHMMVLMAEKGISWEEITKELANR